MKDAKTYEKKIKKILTQHRSAGRHRKNAGSEDIFAVMVEGVLAADNDPAAARKALDVIEEEFVDFNELRVSPTKDIADCLGREYPLRRDKAVEITGALNAIYYRVNDMSAEYMWKMPKTAIRRHLTELGLKPYAAAWVAMTAFGIAALPVDQTLLETLQIDDNLPEDLDLEDAQKFLERAVGKTDMNAAHAAMRTFVSKNAKALAKKRKADAKARAEAEAKAQAAAEAKAKAATEAQAKAAAEAQAKEKESKAKQRKAKRVTKKAAKAKPARKTKSAATRTTKNAAKKTTKKAAKKTAKKTPKRVSRAKKR